jgi:FAD/FMN-containing dehydrogenase
VLADGTVLSSLNTMIKDNAGYDLKQLFIGTEGTLGIVTRAVLRLHPEPVERITALVALGSFADLAHLLGTLRRDLGAALSSFEAMWSDYFELALGALGQVRPFDVGYPFYALVEAEATDPVADRSRLEAALFRVLEAGRAGDAVVAGSLDEAARLWRIRESAGELITSFAPVMAYDVSMPLPDMEGYVEVVRAGVQALGMGRPFGAFGHLGDGNLHLFAGVNSREEGQAVDAMVYGALAGRGSVSAEHGIGSLKKAWLGHTRTPAEIAVMRGLKLHLDPRGILNPGRVI